jgi:hypothetical protein
VAKTKSHPVSVSDLIQARTISPANLDAAIAAFLADPKIGAFELAPGFTVDLTAVVKADRHAMATLKEPTAKGGSRRAAVRCALLLARPIEA